jgi:hypothetical protein
VADDMTIARRANRCISIASIARPAAAYRADRAGPPAGYPARAAAGCRGRAGSVARCPDRDEGAARDRVSGLAEAAASCRSLAVAAAISAASGTRFSRARRGANTIF